MNILGPTPLKRLNEAVAVVWLFGALFTTLALISYYPQDPSWNTATADVPAHNLVGSVGAHFSDFVFQAFGLSAFAVPLFLVALAWKWIRSVEIEAQGVKIFGAILFWISASAMFGLGPDWRLFEESIAPGGLVGMLAAQYLLHRLNLTGSVLVTSTVLLLSLYLISSFSLYQLPEWLLRPRWLTGLGDRWREWLQSSRRRKQQIGRANV